MYGDDEEDLTAFEATPFKYVIDDESEGSSISKEQFQIRNKKLDTLLGSSSLENVYAENEKIVKESFKAVEHSEKAIKETTAKVEKLQTEAITFMNEYRSSFDSNTEKMNKVIASFRESLQSEKKSLSDLRSNLKLEHSEMVTDVVSKIFTLQKDLAMEAKFLDAHAGKTAKLDTQSVEIKSLKDQLNNLTFGKANFNSSLWDLMNYLQKVIDTNDLVLTPSVRHHLADKLTPVFLLLKQLVSVSGIDPIPKQGEMRKRMMMIMMMVMMVMMMEMVMEMVRKRKKRITNKNKKKNRLTLGRN